jgi:hypothetical protein
MRPERIAFVYGRDPYLVALALNPPTIFAHAQRQPGGGNWVIRARARVSVAYVRESRLGGVIPLLGIRAVLHEGMYWALQELGWYFPYTAFWNWEMTSDDPRLR